MTVDILTFGCRLNTYESEVMRGLSTAVTDTVIVNTCAVTAEAERQARQAIRKVARERPGVRIVVTGCAAQIDPASWAALPNVDRVLGNDDKLKPESWLPGAGSAVSDIMVARETAAHLVTELASRATTGTCGLARRASSAISRLSASSPEAQITARAVSIIAAPKSAGEVSVMTLSSASLSSPMIRVASASSPQTMM